MQCKKIPDIIELDSYDGNYQLYEDAVYNLYQSTFEQHTFSFNGKKISQKCIPLFKNKSCTFWHIISSGPNEEERMPDLRRYERIAWPAYILSYCQYNCPNILIWKNKRKGKQRVLLWCRDIDYLVVLDERKDYFLFWTAYPVVYSHTKRKLLKEYNSYAESL